MDADKLQNKLEIETMCTIQHTGWPCNSCFHSMNLKLKEDIHKYWEAVLDIRGDYNDYDWEAIYVPIGTNYEINITNFTIQ